VGHVTLIAPCPLSLASPVRVSVTTPPHCARPKLSQTHLLQIQIKQPWTSVHNIATPAIQYPCLPIAIMSRKAVGLAAFDRSRLTSAQFASHGSNLRTTHASSLSTQLSVFRSLLQQFAQTHAKDIRSNPTFRAEFGRMCAAIGVDPLASSSGGGKEGGSLWSQLLGGSVNDFYFELAVRVVEVCGQTREENGGMIPVKECRQRIMKGRMEGAPEITEYVAFPLLTYHGQSTKEHTLTPLLQRRHPPRSPLPHPPRLLLLNPQNRFKTIHPLRPQRAQHRPK
jgi:hypothetical protein